VTPNNVILSGDSAGGNLALGNNINKALTILTIRLQSRIPDGIHLCYPALNLETNRFTPSFLLCINIYFSIR
jgi:acetyl esterase/lipase